MKTPTTPLPYITRLGSDADGFSDLLTLLTLVFGLTVTVWLGGFWLHVWGAPPQRVVEVARFFAIGWLLFKGLAALIDYAIYACIRSFTEYLCGFTAAFTEQARDDASGEAAERQSTQRDSAVAYLHDYLTRPRQALAERAGPAEPPKAL